jgi:hypothetical protein
LSYTAQAACARWLPFFDALAERCELLVPEHPGEGDRARGELDGRDH